MKWTTSTETPGTTIPLTIAPFASDATQREPQEIRASPSGEIGAPLTVQLPEHLHRFVYEYGQSRSLSVSAVVGHALMVLSVIDADPALRHAVTNAGISRVQRMLSDERLP